MPIKKYNKYFGGDANKAYQAMQEQYGSEKGKQVFYATKNKRKNLKSAIQGRVKQWLQNQSLVLHHVRGPVLSLVLVLESLALESLALGLVQVHGRRIRSGSMIISKVMFMLIALPEFILIGSLPL